MGELIQRDVAQWARKVEAALEGGGGPPHNPGMEARVARLESFAEKTGDRLGRVEERLARVETKLDHKADKNDITAATLKLVLLGGAALAAVLGVLAKGFGWL